jgi:integrase/recombinase XerD
MSVKLRQQKNKTCISFYLDINIGGKRERQYLKGVSLIIAPKTTQDRTANINAKVLAESIRTKRENELRHESNGLEAPIDTGALFLPYLNQFRDNYKRADKQKVVAMVKHFVEFTAGRPVKFKELNENIVSDFKKHLEDKLSGATTKSYFNKFRQVVRRARIDRLCSYDIKTFETRFKLDSNNLKKETLTPEEIQKIADTHCENNTTKLAFVFCCFTGLDFADVFELKWIHITDAGLRKPREKTKVGRNLPLHETALSILSLMDNETEFVFQNLPNRANRNYSWQACDKTLKAIVKRADINKHVTWHVGRHSYGTNLEGDDGTIAQLLGHSNTQMVKVYRRAKQERLSAAVNSLKGVKVK